jgi:hypothetical protein
VKEYLQHFVKHRLRSRLTHDRGIICPAGGIAFDRSLSIGTGQAYCAIWLLRLSRRSPAPCIWNLAVAQGWSVTVHYLEQIENQAVDSAPGLEFTIAPKDVIG